MPNTQNKMKEEIKYRLKMAIQSELTETDLETASNSMEALLKAQRKEIRDSVVKIIVNSKATFFGIKDSEEPTTEEQLYELKAEICTNVEQYFINNKE